MKEINWSEMTHTEIKDVLAELQRILNASVYEEMKPIYGAQIEEGKRWLAKKTPKE